MMAAQKIIVPSHPLQTSITEALCDLFMAANAFYASHSSVAMPELVRTTLAAIYQAMHDPTKPQTAMLILGVSIIATKSGFLATDPGVRAALALARTVLMACA
jgi:hypothetical protein